MTDEAKALVNKLRDENSYYRIQEKHWCIDAEELERQRLDSADLIERLIKAGNELGDYAGHDDSCACVKGWATGPCNCGYTETWNQWRAALGDSHD